MTITVPTQPVAAVLHMAIDGTGAAMWPEATVGRVGKAADGSAKTREAKVMATSVNDDDTPCYDAGIEPVSSPSGEPSFTERYRRLTARTGFDEVDHKSQPPVTAT